MMDFPASPTTGQSFDGGAGTIYVWDGVAWNAVAQATPALILDTPPVNPAVGQLWFRGTTGGLYIYVDDGNSKQWVQIPGTVAAPGVWEPILVQDIPSWTTLDIKDLGAFSDLWLRWSGASLSGDSSLSLRFSSDNGASFYAGANDYVITQLYMQQLPTLVVGGAASTGTFIILASSMGTSPGSGYMQISQFNKVKHQAYEGKYASFNSAGGNVVNNLGGYTNMGAVTAKNALRVIASPGINGRLILQGVRG